MAATLRFDRPGGATIGYLPDHSGLQVQIEHNGPGSVTFSYLNNGERANALDSDDAFIYILDDGVARPDVYLLEDDGDDPTDAAGDARMVTVTGRGAMALLERAIVFPRKHRPGESVVGLDPKFPFVEPAADDNSEEEPAFPTPGRIMTVLLARAQARGAIPQVTWDFDSDRDSAGRIWPEDYTVTYDAGISLLAALQVMLDQGWCDARMDGLNLQLYVPDTVLNTDRPNVILRRGREVLSGPRQRSRRNVRSHLLAIGDEGAAAQSTDATAIARYGRREGFLGQGGMTALDTLNRVADKTLALMNKTAEGFTVEVDLSAEGPKPFTDYNVGDRIRYDQRRLNETEYEPMRVRTLSTTWDDYGNKRVSLELNDLFVERSIRLARRIEGIVNGSSNNTRPPTQPPDPDEDEKIPPRPPGAVSVTSGTVTKESGDVVAVATVSWPVVTQNTDGSVFDDFEQYTVQMCFPTRSGGENWTGGLAVHEPTVAYFQDLPPGEQIKFRVRALDINGNKSDWTESPLHRLATDAQPPPPPGAPSAEVMIGGVRIGWDGRGAFGEPMPVDFTRAIIHMSTSGTGFSVSDATRVASLQGAGFVTIAPLDTNLTYYFRLQTADRNGNVSAPSPTVQAQPRQVVSDDLASQIIRLGALADLERASITTTFLATFESPDDRWLRRTGTGQAVLTFGTSATAAVGNGVARVSGGNGTFEFSNNVPYDPDQLYRVQARVRTMNAPTAGDQFSFGLAAYAHDRVSRVSASNTSTGPDHYAAAYRQAAPTTVGQWTTVAGFMRGRAAAGSLPDAAPNPTPVPDQPDAGPRQVAGGGKYVRPVFQFTGAAATLWEVDQFTVEMLEIPPNVIGTVQIADATIVNAKIALLAVDDANIGNLSVTKLTAGNLTADMVLAAQIRTAALDSGARVVIDPTGIRAYDAASTNTFNLASTGDVVGRGKWQTGTDTGAHVVIAADNETWNGVPLDVEDRSPSMRLYTGAGVETQPALIHNRMTDPQETGTNPRPTLMLRSGRRQTFGRSYVQIIAGNNALSSSVNIAAGNVEIVGESAGSAPPNLFIRSNNSTGGAAAPLTIGFKDAQRLLLAKDQIRAVDAAAADGVLFINDQGGDVEIANRLRVRKNPESIAQAQILPANVSQSTSLVFGDDTVHVRNRAATGWQFLKCQDVIQTNPGSGNIAAGLRQGTIRSAPVDNATAADDVDGFQVADITVGDRQVRTVLYDEVPAIVRAGAEGVYVGGLVATVIAAHQQLTARLSDLETQVQELTAP